VQIDKLYDNSSRSLPETKEGSLFEHSRIPSNSYITIIQQTLRAALILHKHQTEDETLWFWTSN